VGVTTSLTSKYAHFSTVRFSTDAQLLVGAGRFSLPIYSLSIYSSSISSFMSDPERRALRLLLKREWEKTKEDYRAAGKPFGEGRGLDLWVKYGQLTTVN